MHFAQKIYHRGKETKECVPTRRALMASKVDCCQLTRPNWTYVIKDVVQWPNLSKKLETLDPKYPEKINFLVIFQEMCIVIHREVEKKSPL